MPRVKGGTLRAHRELTTSKIFASLEELLYIRGFDGITLADVARGAGLARTAMYNYFPDKESLLVAYVVAEAEGFTDRLDDALRPLEDPVERLRAIISLQLPELARNHLPAGPALRLLLSELAHREVMTHVGQLEERLHQVLLAGRDRRFFEIDDLDATAAMVSACISRAASEAVTDDDIVEAVTRTEAFVLRALGVTFDSDGRPRRRSRRSR